MKMYVGCMYTKNNLNLIEFQLCAINNTFISERVFIFRLTIGCWHTIRVYSD